MKKNWEDQGPVVSTLVDIFPGYGGNCFPRCPNIGRVWCWGSAG